MVSFVELVIPSPVAEEVDPLRILQERTPTKLCGRG